MQRIYLDNNATTVIDPAVAEVMHQCMLEGYMNPASQHQSGQRARRKLESVRADVLRMLGGRAGGMNADQLVFTSGGTESNNLALSGLALSAAGSVPDSNRILVSAIEHPSVEACASYLLSRGFNVEKIPVESDGVVVVRELDRMLQQTPARLVSVMMANNETGVIQPLDQIVRVCRQHGSLVHSDAVQAIGKIPVNFQALDLDAMSFTAHKLHGPRGIGGLMLRSGITPFPMLFGGFQQMGIRPGTEDLCLATGMALAIRIAAEDASRAIRIERLRDQLQESIVAGCRTGNHSLDVIVHGACSPRVPHTLNLSFPGINRQEFIMAADMVGLSVSTGSACASGSSDPSPVLIAMGLKKAVIEGSIRISLSAQTTASEIELASRRIVKISKDLHHQKSL